MMKRFFIAAIILTVCSLHSQEKNDPKGDKSKIPDGYGKVKWGAPLTSVKNDISGKLTYTDDKTVIISKEGEIEYHYGFFYIDPASAPIATEKKSAEDKNAAKPDEKKDEGELFYVAIKFPYLSREEVQARIEKNYGSPLAENVKNHQGAVAWNSDQTIIIMWLDRYENKPYCRRITYISRKIADKMNTHQRNIFKKAELDILDKLKP